MVSECGLDGRTLALAHDHPTRLPKMAKKKAKPINKTRASREGHEFHEAWAARKALQLVFPPDDLVGIAVEGLAPEDEKTAAAASIEVADLVLFYGKRPSFDQARKVAVLQFKYSIRKKRKPVRVSDVKDTIRKFADSYRDHKRRHGATSVARKLSFELVTNRPIDDSLREAVEKIAAGARPSKQAKVQSDQFKTASGLKGTELAEFGSKVQFVGLTGSLKDSKADLSRTLADWSATSTDALALARLGKLRELVRDKAGIAGDGRNVIVRTDIFAALGVSGLEELLPSPESFPDVGKVIAREQLDAAAKRIPKVTKPFLVHAEGGVGKTVFLQSLAKSLSGTHKTILFDCFGGGGYRAPEDARHLPRKGLIHIANLLAAEGLCDPLLPGHDNADEIVRHFRKRLTQAVKTLRRGSSKTRLLIFIDAIDNAAIQARDRGEDSFPQLLLESFRITKPVDGVQLIVSCRTERRDLAKGDVHCEELELRPFSRDEATHYLRSRVKDATQTEIEVAFARSQGNPRILKHLAEGDRGLLEQSEINKRVMLDELLAAHIESALEEASKQGYSNETIKAFLAGLAVLPPPVPVKEYANALGMSESAIQSFAADLYPLLEKTKHGLVFRDEPTETYVRNHYGADDATLRRVADNLFKKQGDSVYAASALPGLLQKLDAGDLLFKLAMDDRFPAAITTDVGKREIRYSRLKAAAHYAARKDDFDQLVHLLVEMSTIAAVTQRGATYIRENPALVVASGDVVAMRRLFETRTPWPGTRHARLAIANVLSNDFEEAQRHVVSAIEWINHAWSQDRESPRERNGPDILDIACVPLCRIVQGRVKDAKRALRSLNDWAAFDVAHVMFSLLSQAVRAGVIEEARIREFHSVSPSAIGVLASGLSFFDLPRPLRRSQIRKLAAASRTKKAIKRKESFSGKNSYDIDDGLAESAALAIATRMHKEALDILAVLPSTRPSSWTYLDHFPDGSSKAFVLRAVLGAVAAKRAVTERDLLPKELWKLCKPLTASLSGEALRKAALAKLEAQYKAQPKSDGEKKEISYEEKGRMETFLNRRMERLFRIAQALEKVMSSAIGKADKAFVTLLSVWKDLAKAEDEYTDRQKGRQLFDILGSTLAIFCLRVREDLKATSVQAATAALIGSKSTNAYILFDFLSVLAKRPNWHASIDVAAAKARSLIELEDDVGQRGLMFASLAQAILPASHDEAAAYFRIGLKEMDAFGSGDYHYTNELLLFAASLEGPELSEQDFHTLSNVCEMNMAYEEQKFPWFVFGRGMAAAAGPRMFAKLGRWDDRDKISLEYTLLPFLTALIERRKISPEVALSLMRLADPAELHGCGTGTFAAALHKNAYVNEEALLQELVSQFRANNPGIPSPSATDELRKLTNDVLGPGSLEALHLGAAASRYSELIDQQNDHRNYHGIGDGLLPQRDLDKEEQQKRKTLARIAARTDAADEASMIKAIRAFNKVEYPYDVKDEFFDSLRAKVPRSDRSKYIRIVARLDELFIYWKLHELGECRKAWAGSSPALSETFRDLAVPFIQIHFEKFIRDDSLSGSMLRDVAGFTGVAFSELAVELVKVLARSNANYSAAIWMALAAIVNERAKPGEAQSALHRLLTGSAVRLAAGVKDGAWRAGLYPADTESELAAGLVWLKLGSPLGADRWRATHAIRSLARLSRWDVIDAVVSLWSLTAANEFQAPELKFYFLHARLWLLIALARLALDEPAAVSKYEEQLLAIVKDAQQPHVLMRHFAAEALKACHRAGKISLSAAEAAFIRCVDASPFPRVKYNRARTRAYDGDRPKGSSRPPDYFGLDYDFQKYDAVNLADVFARPVWELNDAITGWVRKYDQSVGYMYESGGRSAPRSRGYGLVSHYHVYGQYLGWTCILFAAGDFLAKYAVHDAYSSSETDPWKEWLGRRCLTRSDGLWLSDGMDATPLETQVNLLEKDDKGLVLTGDKAKLLRLAGIDATLGNELIVEGNWKSSDGIDVSVSSVLVPARAAKAFAAKLAETEPFHAWLPTLDAQGSADEYERSDRKDCEAWIVTPSPEVQLDEDDPLGARSAMRRPYFKKEINALGSLTTTDPFMRWWTDSEGAVVAHAEAWGREIKYREDGSQTGERLSCSSGFLEKVLGAKKASLVVLIKIQQYKKDTPKGEGPFVNSSAVALITSTLGLTFIAGPTNRVL